MNRAYVLAMCALGLAGVVVWDYWPKASPVVTVQATATPPQAVALLNPLSQRAMADFQALFDHPLFTPTRSPPASVMVTPDAEVIAEAPAIVTADPVLPPKPVLMGTVTSPMPGGAYLGDDSGGPVVFLRPGQTAQGLTLQTVLAESAEFMGPDGPVTLPLQDTPPPASETPAVPDMPPTMSTTLPSP